MRKFALLFSLTLFAIAGALAQSQPVSGKVSGPDGNPIPGVLVTVVGTSAGTIADQDGVYTVNAAADANLAFSSMGMQPLTVAVAGRKTVDVVMQLDARSIDEVVVTALGITRSEKSLGYAVSEVKSSTFEDGRESNVLNSLSGKVAGVNILQSSGTAGGASKINLRGQSSLNSSSQPLFVVDGVPINNDSYIPTSGNNGSVDAGSRIGDIASDDIESMNVLKGAAATALYGARAKDGVIVITTKKGARNQPLAVSVNSSFRFDSALKLPDYQNSYGPGDTETGAYSTSAWNGWGPRIEGQQVKNYLGETLSLQAYPNNVRDFFKTGTTFANSISLSGGDDKSDFRLGISSTNQKGIVPSNTYDRYNFTFNGGRQLKKWLLARVSMSYINSTSEGRPAQGSNDQNVFLSNVFQMPRTMNTSWLRDNWIDENGKPIKIGDGGMATVNNPYWVINKNKYTGKLDRVMGSVFLEVSPVKGLKISNNLGVDFFYESSRRVWAKETFGIPKGRFETVDWNSSTMNNDLIATYDVDLNHDFSLKVIGGMNLLQIRTKTQIVNAVDLLVADVYSYANAEVTTPTNRFNERRLVGVFGEAGLSWRDLAFVTVTGRNDWSSTMPKSHRSYFYPSISASVLLTELLPKNDVLTFGKVRANFAMVGSDTAPYALNETFSPVNNYFLQYLGAGSIPHGGLSGYIPATNTYPTPDLQPQMKSEWELGLDLGFFHQRLRFGATYYYNSTRNNIARFEIPPSTGYLAYRKNAGVITNSGVEITLGATPVKAGDFTWDIDFNFATNSQKVKSLDKGMTEYSLTSGYNGLQVKAAVGEPFSLYGLGWDRDPDGNIVINKKSGLRMTGNMKNLGKIAPDFTLGINNSLRWKGLSLSFLVDIKEGGKMFSRTASTMRTSGLGKETLLNDRQPIVDQGVNRIGSGANATYEVNKTAVDPFTYFDQNFKTSNTEGLIFDAGFVKLREVIAGYSLPKKWLEHMPIKNVFIGFEARNLWIIHSHVPHIDPEANFFNSSEIGHGVEFGGVPSTRSLGFNVKFNF